MRPYWIIPAAALALLLWIWLLTSSGFRPAIQPEVRQLLGGDTEAVLLVYDTELLTGLMTESGLSDSLPAGGFWPRALKGLQACLELNDPEYRLPNKSAECVIVLRKDGSMLVALDGRSLAKPRQGNLYAGYHILSGNPPMKPVMTDSLFDAALASAGGRMASWVGRQKVSLMPGGQAELSGWASLELDLSSERWLFQGYLFHSDCFEAGSANLNSEETGPTPGLRGEVFYFGNYAEYLSWIAREKGEDWHKARTAAEDSCGCDMRDLFGGWTTGVASYWASSEEAVLCLVALDSTSSEAVSPLADLSLNSTSIVNFPSLPGTAFGLPDKFYVMRQIEGQVLFATSERALALYRLSDSRPAYPGVIRTASILKTPPSGHFPGGTQVNGLTTVMAARQEKPGLTYLQWALGPVDAKPRAAGSMLWMLNLPNKPSGSLHPVFNHLTGEQEVFAEAESQFITLVGMGGRELRKLPTDGPVIGKVWQIDLHKNGKLQWVFSTERTLYAYDRNGNPLSGFPVKLQGGVAGPLSVFDYESNHDYRIVVPMKDGRLINLGTDGRPVKGWQHNAVKSPVVSTKHLRFGSQDYIICIHSDGGLAALGRNGKPKFTIAGKADGMTGKIQTMAESRIEDSYFVFGHQDNSVWTLTCTDAKPVQLMPAMEGPALWQYMLVDDDSRPDFIFMTDQLLTLMLHGSEREVVIPINEVPDSDVQVAVLAGGKRILLIDQPLSGLIYAYDTEGNPVPGFPIEGEAPYALVDLNGDGPTELVVCGVSGLVCYDLKNMQVPAKGQ